MTNLAASWKNPEHVLMQCQPQTSNACVLALVVGLHGKEQEWQWVAITLEFTWVNWTIHIIM